MTRTIRYGWKPDLPDFRDLYYKDVHFKDIIVAPVDQRPSADECPDDNVVYILPEGLSADGLPLAVSLREKMPKVFNQGALGSCTANAGLAMWTFVHGGGPYSRLQVYYHTREMMGTVDVDSGGYLRDTIQVLCKKGSALEEDWPYIEENFRMAPPYVALREGMLHRASVYSRLAGRADYRNCLVSGFPFIIGISLFGSFESNEIADNGLVGMPLRGDRMLGGHAVCVIGYTVINGREYYEVRNSWGKAWGDDGHFYLPAEYIEHPDLACDAWTIRK